MPPKAKHDAHYKDFDTKQLTKIKSIVKKASDCLTNAQVAYICSADDPAHTWDTAFTKYFGKATKAATEDVVATLAHMQGEWEHDNFTVALQAPDPKKPEDATENANVLAYTEQYLHHRVPVGQKALWQKNKSLPKPSTLTIRPRTLAEGKDHLVEFALDQQCGVQVFLHEMSHFSAGLDDIDEPHCYGMAGVEYCKKKGIVSAVRNAENLGMFLLAFANFQEPKSTGGRKSPGVGSKPPTTGRTSPGIGSQPPSTGRTSPGVGSPVPPSTGRTSPGLGVPPGRK